MTLSDTSDFNDALERAQHQKSPKHFAVLIEAAKRSPTRQRDWLRAVIKAFSRKKHGQGPPAQLEAIRTFYRKISEYPSISEDDVLAAIDAGMRPSVDFWERVFGPDKGRVVRAFQQRSAERWAGSLRGIVAAHIKAVQPSSSV